VCSDFLYNFCLKCDSFQAELGEIWSKMYIGVHVKYSLYLSGCNETWIFATDSWKTLKFHENPSRGDRLFCADRQTARHDKVNSLFCAIVQTHLNIPFELTHFPSHMWLLGSTLKLITDPSTLLNTNKSSIVSFPVIFWWKEFDVERIGANFSAKLFHSPSKLWRNDRICFNRHFGLRSIIWTLLCYWLPHIFTPTL